MAEALKKSKSKIPRYKKTKVPVLSKNYTKVLREVKTKKSIINFKESERELLKTQQLKLLDKFQLQFNRENRAETTKEAKLCCEEEEETNNLKSEVRCTIKTPGGTKRKGESLANFLLSIEHIEKRILALGFRRTRLNLYIKLRKLSNTWLKALMLVY